MVVMFLIGPTLADLSRGDITTGPATHPTWAILLFIAACAPLLVAAFKTTPPRPIRLPECRLLVFFAYITVASFASQLVRSALRYRLALDTVPESIPLNLIAAAVFIATFNASVWLMRPQRDT